MNKIKTLTIGLILLSLVLLPVLSVKADGLTVQYNLTGVNDNDLFGWPVAFVGDVNNDTFEDFAVGATGFDDGGLEDAGRVYIYSGQDGSLIRTHTGTINEGFYGSAIVGIGDVNSDGNDDYAILDPRHSTGTGGFINNEFGRLFAYSGFDGSVLWTYVGNTAFQFLFGNVQMAMTGDFNADTVADLVVGGPNLSTNAARAGGFLILDATNGNLISQYDGSDLDGRIGMSLDSGSDLNNDGTQDFLIGETTAVVGGEFGAGRARVISGADLATVLFSQNGVAERFGGFGVSVAFAGDTNNDGTVDIAVGSQEAAGGIDNSGATYVFSGADGAQLVKYDGTESEGLFGNVVARAGDPTNDGYAEIALAALQGTSGGNASAGRVEVFSGKINALWTRSGGGAVGALQGSDIKGNVDIDQDGIPDLLVGSTGGKVGADIPGRARLFLSNQKHTPTGSSIEIHPIVGRQNDTFTYTTVDTEGDTTAAYSPGTGENFRTKQGSNEELWSATTTAAFTGNITVCLNYNQTLYANENQIDISHLESGSWVQYTTTLDTTNDIACAAVTSL